MPRKTLIAAAAVNSIPIIDKAKQKYYINSGEAARAEGLKANTTVQRKVSNFSNKQWRRASKEETENEQYMSKYDYLFEHKDWYKSKGGGYDREN